MVPKSSAIAQVMGVTNAVTIDADAVGELTLIGPGAGGEATASAVVADIADVARGVIRPTFGIPAVAMRPSERVEMQRHEGGYYIRLTVHDRRASRRVSLSGWPSGRYPWRASCNAASRARRRIRTAARTARAAGADHLCGDRG